MLDLVIIVLALSAAVGGWRLGFVARAFSWFGLAVGVFIATRIIPIVGNSEEDPQRLLLLGMVILFSGAIIGQVIGLLVGARLRTALRSEPVVTADRVGGSIAGAAGVLIALLVFLPPPPRTPPWPAGQTPGSRDAPVIPGHLPGGPPPTHAFRPG